MVSASAGLPPCCARCSEYDRDDGVCGLLAEPGAGNRRRLLTMPCDVQRRVEQRFRGLPPQVTRDALAAWLDPAWDADDISLSYGKAPRDARLWLGSWPYVYLGRDAARGAQRHSERPRPPASPREQAETRPVDPGLVLGVTRALEKVRRIDPVGYAMLLDSLRDRFDAEAWAAALDSAPGPGAAAAIDREALAIHRHAAHFHDILEASGDAPGAPDAALAAWQILRRRLAAPVGGPLGGKAGSEHPDAELVVAHASGDLSPEYGLAITRHLTVCDDGRCAAVLRPVVAGAAVARAELYQERERTFECPDPLWDGSTIAREEGCSLDWLLNEAMKSYAGASGR